MISKDTFQFLKSLSVNNNKDWFNNYRDSYLLAKKDFELFIADIIVRISIFDKNISGVKPKDCIFRIFRDTRFSKEKTPYKNNFGAYIAKGGRKMGSAGYYIHIEPDNSFYAGGVYMPPPENLKNIRDAILNDTAAFKKLISSREFTDRFGEIWGEKLTGVPRGYDKNFKDIDLLKYKSYSMVEMVSDKQVTARDLGEKAIQSFLAMKAVNDFLNKAMGI